MGQGPQGLKGDRGDPGQKGSDSVINYSTLSQGLIADNTFKESVKNTIMTNANLFKGEDGVGIKTLRITNGTLIAGLTDGKSEITASGAAMGPAGKDGRGIKRVDFNNQNGSMTVVLEGTDANTDGPNFTTTTNFGENLIRGKTLWCADGQVCQIPTGNAYINLPVRNTEGGNAQSQVLRIGNWEIGQNSAGSLQFTNMISIAGVAAGTNVITRGNVFTMNTAGNFYLTGNETGLGNGWTLKSNSGSASFQKDNVDKAWVNSAGNFYVTGNETGVGNNWTLKTDSLNIKFQKDNVDKALVNSSGDIRAGGNLYTDGGVIGLDNGWTLKTALGWASFQKDDVDKAWVNSDGDLHASTLKLGTRWRINPRGGNMNFEYDGDWKGSVRTDGKVASRT
jgi:hypothetical protein